MERTLMMGRYVQKSIILDYILSRIRNDQNFMGLVIGGTGSGKSYSSLAIAEQLDPNFTINNVVFSAGEFVELLTSGNLKKGSVVIYDEVGTSMSARTFWSKSNLVLSYILQTFRKDNIIVFFTTPTASFLDINARRVIHTYFETAGINRTEKYVMIKPYFIQVNNKEGKIYKKYLRIRDKGKTYLLKMIKVGMPSKMLIKAYDKKADAYKDTIKEEASIHLRANINQQSAIQQTMPVKSLTDRQKEVYELMKTGLSQNEVSKQLGIAQGNVSTHVRLIRQKGYVV